MRSSTPARYAGRLGAGVLAITAGLAIIYWVVSCRHPAATGFRNTILVSSRNGGGQFPVWESKDSLFFMVADPESTAAKGIYRISSTGDDRELVLTGGMLGPEAWDPVRERLYVKSSLVIYEADTRTGKMDKAFGSLSVHSISVSPKGHMAAVVQDRKGVHNIALLRFAGGICKAVTLTDFGSPPETVHAGMAPSWLDDGRSIIFAHACGYEGKSVSWYELDTVTEATKESAVPHTAEYVCAAPNGRYAYTVGEEVFVVADGHAPVRVAADYEFCGPHSIAWSPDSHRLAYTAEDYALHVVEFRD